MIGAVFKMEDLQPLLNSTTVLDFMSKQGRPSGQSPHRKSINLGQEEKSKISSIIIDKKLQEHLNNATSQVDTDSQSLMHLIPDLDSVCSDTPLLDKIFSNQEFLEYQRQYIELKKQAKGHLFGSKGEETGDDEENDLLRSDNGMSLSFLSEATEQQFELDNSNLYNIQQEQLQHFRKKEGGRYQKNKPENEKQYYDQVGNFHRQQQMHHHLKSQNSNPYNPIQSLLFTPENLKMLSESPSAQYKFAHQYLVAKRNLDEKKKIQRENKSHSKRNKYHKRFDVEDNKQHYALSLKLEEDEALLKQIQKEQDWHSKMKERSKKIVENDDHWKERVNNRKNSSQENKNKDDSESNKSSINGLDSITDSLEAFIEAEIKYIQQSGGHDTSELTEKRKLLLQKLIKDITATTDSESEVLNKKKSKKNVDEINASSKLYLDRMKYNVRMLLSEYKKAARRYDTLMNNTINPLDNPQMRNASSLTWTTDYLSSPLPTELASNQRQKYHTSYAQQQESINALALPNPRYQRKEDSLFHRTDKYRALGYSIPVTNSNGRQRPSPHMTVNMAVGNSKYQEKKVIIKEVSKRDKKVVERHNDKKQRSANRETKFQNTYETKIWGDGKIKSKDVESFTMRMQMFLNYQRLSREEKLKELERKIKNDAHPTIHEVMHKHHAPTDITGKSDIFTRLYKEAEEKAIRLQRSKEEKTEIEKDELTFKPMICVKSLKLLQKKGRKPFENTWDKAIFHSEKEEEYAQDLSLLALKNEVMENLLVEDKNPETLSEDEKYLMESMIKEYLEKEETPIKKKNQKIYAEETAKRFSFHPNLNKGSPSKVEVKSTFEERLVKSIKSYYKRRGTEKKENDTKTPGPAHYKVVREGVKVTTNQTALLEKIKLWKETGDSNFALPEVRFVEYEDMSSIQEEEEKSLENEIVVGEGEEILKEKDQVTNGLHKNTPISHEVVDISDDVKEENVEEVQVTSNEVKQEEDEKQL